MSVKVRIRNFQSIQDSTFTIDGFTVLTGPNNSGKSAVVRALRGVFANSPAGALVRRGEKQLTVDVEFADGNTVRWEKGTGVNRYTLNGKVLDLVGARCPDEVLALGVGPVQIGNNEIWPQVARQLRDQVFLTDQPGSVLAEAVADVERVGQLNRALQASEKDRRSAASDLKARTQDRARLAASLQRFDGLETLASAFDVLEKDRGEIEVLQNQAAWLRARGAQLQQARNRANALAGIQGVGQDLPDPVKLDKAIVYLQTSYRLQRERDLAAARIAALPGAPDVDAMTAKIGDLPTKISTAIGIHTLVKDHLTSLRNAERIRARFPSSESLAWGAPPAPPAELISDIASASAISSLHVKMNGYRLDRLRLESEIREAEESALLAETQFRETLREVQHCPLCGSDCRDHDGKFSVQVPPSQSTIPA